MDARATFVVEVVGELREREDVVIERVAQALNLDDAKARALVERMPGVITRGMPETRAAKVALRLQAAGIAAMHRSASAPPFQGSGHPFVTTVADDDDAASVSIDGAFDAVLGGGDRAPSPLAGVPSVDATLIEERDVRADPKLTPVSEAGFGAADIVVPTAPRGDRPGPRDRSARPAPTTATFSAPIVEGGATADPKSADAPSDADPSDAGPRYVRREGPGSDAAARDRSLRDSASRERAGRDTPARERRAEPAVAPSSRARDAIARDRATEGSKRGGDSDRPPLLPVEVDLAPPERAYRSTRSSAEIPITLSAPPEETQKRSGVRDEALSAAGAKRRGAFGRRLSALIVLPAIAAWGLGAWFVWLLLPAGLRSELWTPLVAATAVSALFGALVAGVATARIAYDVGRLRDAADRVAMGDLVAPVELARRDELGEVATAIDRMRMSLQEGLERLRRRKG